MKEFSAPIGGLSCQSCKVTVEKRLSKIPGVKEAHVSLLRSEVDVHYDETLTQPQDFILAIQSLGYSCSPKEASLSPQQDHSSHHDPSHSGHHHDSSDATKVDLMSLSMDMNIMGMDHSAPPEKTSASKWKTRMIWVNLLLTIVVIVLAMTSLSVVSGVVQWILTSIIIVSNWSMFKTGWRGLRRWYPNMYSLVFLGATAGYLYSLIALFVGVFSHQEEMLFFDAVAAVLSFLAIGDFAQAKGTELVRKNLGQVQNDFPSMITRISDGKEELVPLSQIRSGDKIHVKAGEMLAFDGFLESEEGEVVETLLTGEMEGVKKHSGDPLTSGTYTKNHPLLMVVSHPLQEGFFYKVRASLIEIEQKKTPVLELVDRISYYFVPVVLLLSLVSFLFWGFYAHSWIFALKVALSVLVIACPCALGLATPFAIMIFFGTAFREGFLLKNSRILSFVNKLDGCVMDKTGTLTMGKLSVVEWKVTPGKNLEDEIFTMESQSSHPYARAILQYLKENSKGSLLAIEDFHMEEGVGIVGKVQETSLAIGNSLFVTLTEEEKNFEKEQTQLGKTVLWIRREGKNEGSIVLSDSLRLGAREWVNFAKKRYKTLSIFSGDNTASVAFVANELGIDNFFGNLKPFDKLQKLKKLQEEGHKILMMGDGINDSLVLVQADLSLSLGERTNLGGQSGDIISLARDLRPFMTLLGFARRTNRVVIQNLFWAFIYNILALPWAMGLFVPLGWGWVNPMVGAFGMAVSSLLVVLNSLRLIRFKG